MKNQAREAVKKTKCLAKLAEITQLTPRTLELFVEGKRDLSDDHVQAILSEAKRQEILTGRRRRK